MSENQNNESNLTNVDSNDMTSTQKSITRCEPTVETRIDRLEQMVEKLIKSQTPRNRQNNGQRWGQGSGRPRGYQNQIPDKRRCYSCGIAGHLARNCNQNKRKYYQNDYRNQSQSQRPRHYRNQTSNNRNSQPFFMANTVPKLSANGFGPDISVLNLVKMILNM